MSPIFGATASWAGQHISTGLGSLAGFCKTLGTRGRALIACIAGGVSVLAMAPFFLSPVLFVVLPVLVWLIDGARRTEGGNRSIAAATFAVGWWFGFGYFLCGLFWIAEAFLVEAERFLWALPFAVTLLPAGLALFFGVATAVAARISRPGAELVVALALTLSAAEWLRGHVLTGFPWNTLGYALTYPLQLMQSAALIGIYGLTLLTVLIFALPAVLWVDAGARTTARRGRQMAVAVAIVPLLMMTGFGVVRLSVIPDKMVDGVRFRIVQPSIVQREKWRPENQRRIFFDHIDLSNRDATGAAVGLAGVTHIIWPEAAMPFRPLESEDARAAIGQMLPPNTYLISGGLRVVNVPATAAGTLPGLEARNSLMVFGAGGEAVAIYDKIHLVPFGEYLPFKTILERIGLEQLTRQRGGFGIGATPRPLLAIPGLPPTGPLICYEAIFPGAIVQGSERPSVLINLTNDGWFGNTTGPRQHLHQVRVRAVEEGLPVIRAANNGISAVIAPSGRITARLDLNERGAIDAELPHAIGSPPYALLGDFGFLVGWVACAVALFMLRRTNYRSRTAQ